MWNHRHPVKTYGGDGQVSTFGSVPVVCYQMAAKSKSHSTSNETRSDRSASDIQKVTVRKELFPKLWKHYEGHNEEDSVDCIFKRVQ